MSLPITPTPTIHGVTLTCPCGGPSFVPLVVGTVQCTACHELFETSGFDSPAQPVPARASSRDGGRILDVPVTHEGGDRSVTSLLSAVCEPQAPRFDREDLIPVIADAQRVHGQRRLHGAVRRAPVTWDDGPTGEVARCDHLHARIDAALSCAQIMLEDLAEGRL